MVVLPRMSPTAKVLLAAQAVYAAAPLEGMVQPMVSPTTWVVCAAELCSKAATAATTRKTMFNLLAIALCVEGQVAPVLCYSVFALFLNLCSVFYEERILLGAMSRVFVFIGGGDAMV